MPHSLSVIELAVAIGVERRIGVHVDHRRHPAVVRLLEIGIDAERAFLQRHVVPHRHAVVQLAVAALDA